VGTKTAEAAHRVRIDLPGVKIGLIEAEGVRVTNFDARLAHEMDAACAEVRRLHSLDSLRQWEPVREVRKMFTDWGLDPSKYRPSSEALLRRILKDNTLPRISNVVDVGNWGAIETGWPYGCYDRGKIEGPIDIRHGKAGEEYAGIGRPVLRLAARPVFSDCYSPFGSPVSDSTRTMVTLATHELLVIICAPETSCDSRIEESLCTLSKRLARWCSAKNLRQQIITNDSAHHARPFGTNVPAVLTDLQEQNERIAFKAGAD
jgi:DNA/RNA-binding domain of Phe-tRNA-synthetase-like protein